LIENLYLLEEEFDFPRKNSDSISLSSFPVNPQHQLSHRMSIMSVQTDGPRKTKKKTKKLQTLDETSLQDLKDFKESLKVFDSFGTLPSKFATHYKSTTDISDDAFHSSDDHSLDSGRGPLKSRSTDNLSLTDKKKPKLKTKKPISERKVSKFSFLKCRVMLSLIFVLTFAVFVLVPFFVSLFLFLSSSFLKAFLS